MKYYFIPEILFSILVIAFLWSLPTYIVVKVIFTVIYFILLIANSIEQWRRARMVGKIKIERRRQLEMEVDRIKIKKEELVRQEEEKARLRAKEEQEYKQKMQVKKEQEVQKALQEAQVREKQALRSEISHYLQGFVNKNLKTLVDLDYLSLLTVIEKKGIDTRLLFAPGMSETGLEEMLSDLKGKVSCSLVELVEMGAHYQENFRHFINLLSDKGFKISNNLLQQIIDEEVENKKYQNFKNQFYNERKALKYTTDLKDYVNAFVEVYGQNVRLLMKYFVRLLGEEIDKKFTMELVKPLVEQELKKKSG